MIEAIVTGGAGFIGSHIVEDLLDKNWKIKVIDNMSTGQRENVDMFKKNPNYEFYKINIAEKFDKNLFKKTDYVFHVAGLADIIPSIEKPIEYFNSNVTGTLNVLEAARISKKLKKFVYTASSSCYGIPKKYPTPETADINPEYPYALTKYLGEECILHWNKIYDLPAISLRLFNVYGPRARSNNVYGAVFKVFLTQKLKNLPLTIVGNGNQKRDFVFVKDVAKAAYLSAISNISGKCLNIGAGNPRKINDLAKMVSDKTVYIPKRPGEPEITWADISKAKRLLNWKPEIELEQGVEVMLKNIEYWKNAPAWTPKKIEKETKRWFECLNKNG